MTIDPICGMTVDEASVPRIERDGPAFRFCGDHCRQKFLPTLPTATHEQKPQGKAIYLCPMHPEVQQEHPGDCPKCGMALEPKPVTGDTDGEENAELRDMTKCFWIGAALAVPSSSPVRASSVSLRPCPSWWVSDTAPRKACS